MPVAFATGQVKFMNAVVPKFQRAIAIAMAISSMLLAIAGEHALRMLTKMEFATTLTHVLGFWMHVMFAMVLEPFMIAVVLKCRKETAIAMETN
jgi:hypothetical protein